MAAPKTEEVKHKAVPVSTRAPKKGATSDLTSELDEDVESRPEVSLQGGHQSCPQRQQPFVAVRALAAEPRVPCASSLKDTSSRCHTAPPVLDMEMATDVRQSAREHLRKHGAETDLTTRGEHDEAAGDHLRDASVEIKTQRL
jgi:hypothetical protein